MNLVRAADKVSIVLKVSDWQYLSVGVRHDTMNGRVPAFWTHVPCVIIMFEGTNSSLIGLSSIHGSSNRNQFT